MSEPVFKISEIFYSIQGEGAYVGTACVFIRFSGCDLDCEFCDEGGAFGSNPNPREMTAAELRKEANALSGLMFPNIVFTGGEPSMHMQGKDDIDALEKAFDGCFCAMESNGHFPVPEFINWLTVSPKDDNFEQSKRKINELKLLMDRDGTFYGINPTILERTGLAEFIYVQPITGTPEQTKMSSEQAVKFVLDHPQFRVGCRLQNELGVQCRPIQSSSTTLSILGRHETSFANSFSPRSTARKTRLAC